MVTETAVTAFHCATPALSQLEDQLQHFCHYGRALTLVIGSPGSGRSHLARRLKQGLTGQMPVALIEAHPMLSANQLDSSALQQLGLTQYALQNAELSLAISQAAPGRRVLIVDDAHDLGLHLLRELMEAVAAEWEREDPRLCLVLIGDEMLETALAELAFNAIPSSDIQRLHLPVFSVDDAQRLATVWAASMAEPEPNRDVIRAAWQKSYGRPGLILHSLTTRGATVSETNEDEQLDVDSVEHISTPRYSLMEKYGWLKLPLIFLGVFALALILLYQREFNLWISEEQPAVAVEKSTPGSRQSLDIDGSNAVPVDEATERYSPDSLAIIDESEADISAVQTDSDTPSLTIESTAEPVQQITDNQPVVTSKNIVTEAPSPAAVATKPASNKTNEAAFSDEERRLLEFSADYFAVQIIGLSDEKALQRYQRQPGLEKSLHYRGWRNGKPWHVLVLAAYADRAAAERTRDQLPEAIRKQGPWIKPMAVIHQDIRSASKQR